MKLPGPAPIALFAFNRPDTTRSTLQALEKCETLADRPVYLFCDGPRPQRADDEQAVAQVRSILQGWAAGRRVKCRFSDSNCGLRASIIRGVTDILEQHQRIIVLEDDLIVAPGFLKFMQQSLDSFEHTPRVWQISGYMTPHRRRFLQPGFLRLPCCWGWGTWQDRWRNFQDDASYLLLQVQQLDTARFNLDGTYDYLGDLRANAEGRLNTWHVRWYASMFVQQALAYYPGQTLTRNIGFDAAGTHCSSTRMADIYHRQVMGACPPPPPSGIVPEESGDLLQQMQNFYRFQQRIWSGVTWQQRLRAKAGVVWKKLRRCLP